MCGWARNDTLSRRPIDGERFHETLRIRAALRHLANRSMEAAYEETHSLKTLPLGRNRSCDRLRWYPVCAGGSVESRRNCRGPGVARGAGPFTSSLLRLPLSQDGVALVEQSRARLLARRATRTRGARRIELLEVGPVRNQRSGEEVKGELGGSRGRRDASLVLSACPPRRRPLGRGPVRPTQLGSGHRDALP
jgi:hypothetical protein